jgi:hypothetical protein
MPRKSFPLTARAQVVVLKHFTTFTNDEIAAIVGCSARQVTYINSNAIARGYVKERVIEDKHVQDAPRSGRPKKHNEDVRADTPDSSDEAEPNAATS